MDARGCCDYSSSLLPRTDSSSVTDIVLCIRTGNNEVSCDCWDSVMNRAPEDADDDTGVVEYMMMKMPWRLVVPLPSVGVDSSSSTSSLH